MCVFSDCPRRPSDPIWPLGRSHTPAAHRSREVRTRGAGMVSNGREAVIVDVMRTTFGKRKGALAHWHPVDLLAFVLSNLVERTGVDPERVDDVIGGCVSQVGEQSTNVARNGWVAAGLPQTVPATRSEEHTS